MQRRHPLRGVLVLATVSVVALGVSSAWGDEADQVPVTQGETVTLWAGSVDAPVDLLANDSDPDGEKLQVCRFGDRQDYPNFYVDPVDSKRNGKVEVNLDPTATGSYTYDYQACDHSYLVPATLTVEVQPIGVTTVEKVPGRPSMLRVTNPDQHDIFFAWGSPRTEFTDFAEVASGDSVLVRAGSSRVDWAAGFEDGDIGVYTGYGTVTGLKASDARRAAAGRVRVPAWMTDRAGDPRARRTDETAAIDTADTVDPTTVAPPITQPEEITLWAGASTRVPVLRNDSDPQGQHLDVCRIDPSGRTVSAFTQLTNTGFQVETSENGAGTFAITYYACNDARLAPGTVTVHLRRAKPVRVTADGGELRIVNPNGESVRVDIVDLDDFVSTRTVRVDAHAVRRVHVDGTYLRWYAEIGHPQGSAGDGRIHLHP